MIFAVRFDKDMAPRLQEVVELCRPQSRARIDIYDVAANVRSQRRAQAINHVIYTVSALVEIAAHIYTPHNLGLTMLNVLFESFNDLKDAARGRSLEAEDTAEAAGIKLQNVTRYAKKDKPKN